MARIEPLDFQPSTCGKATFVRLPDQPEGTRIDILKIAPGITLARSQFSADAEHVADILRRADQVLLTINLSGSMRLTDAGSGEKHVISKSEAWAIRPRGKIMHRRVDKGIGCSNLVIAFDIDALESELRDCVMAAFDDSKTFVRLQLPLPEHRTFSQLFDGREGPATLVRKHGQCLTLIGHVLEELLSRPDPLTRSRSYGPDILVERVKAVLGERLGETVSLSELATLFGTNHATLNRVFHDETGQTVFECLRELRLEAARTRIATGNASLTTIAYDCGFSSPSHLSTAFRKRFGFSASAYREQLRLGFGK
ncbi:AraC family transcriptional regulator [Roseibium aggregatum]|uniref:Helix-turn-helix domain-containing protein n=1 Tax=Roseibium aggregatum TaxID=187304 RepID=A0A939EBL3_9HYPH|nr:helix-turn-helix domain-containing protein [Roseibium aggregatum]MBN9668905.1 helix-turn-helix domain-containing protein [Roseibium aggregatum]